MIPVITRAQWGATAKLGARMSLPARELWLHHSVTALTSNHSSDMKAIERIGVERFGRFSYSWAYHAKNRVLLEGAGDTIGAHTANHNSIALGLVLIGNYEELDLTAENKEDIRQCIQWLKDTKRLRPGTYPTGGHRDLKQTACPGANAYADLAELRLPPSSQPTTPTPPEDDDMKSEIITYEGAPDGQLWITGDYVTKRRITKEHAGAFVWLGRATWDPAKNAAWVWPQDIVDRITSIDDAIWNIAVGIGEVPQKVVDKLPPSSGGGGLDYPTAVKAAREGVKAELGFLKPGE